MGTFAFSTSVIACADEKEVLVYAGTDEKPLWRRPLHAPILAVAASAGYVLTLEASGQLAWWDAQAGTYVSGMTAAGATNVALAPSGACAVALPDSVLLVDGSGPRSAPVAGAQALSFSRDGSLVGVGTGDGRIELVDYASAASTASRAVDAPVTGIAERVPGEWLACGGSTVWSVDPEVTRVTGMSGATFIDIACSPRGSLFALATPTLALALAWPSRETAANFRYVDRRVMGVAFGRDDALGVGLEWGDANRMDLRQRQVCRTDTHPGRPHNRWMLMASFEAPVLAAAL